MGYRETVGEMNGLRMKMLEMRKEIRALQESIEPEDVSDYAFMTEEGEVMLSALFGDKKTLFMVHNMGQSCSYCTQWADGLNGVLGHLEDRAAFVVSSPDLPDKQKAFAGSRGWKFQWCLTMGQALLRTWATAWAMALCLACQSSKRKVTVSHASLIRSLVPAMISMRYGTSLI